MRPSATLEKAICFAKEFFQFVAKLYHKLRTYMYEKCFGKIAKYDMLKDPQAQNGVYKITMCDSPSKN